MVTLVCKNCNNIWNYKGSNPYCTNCSRCKFTVFIKKSSVDKSYFLVKKEMELEAMQQG